MTSLGVLKVPDGLAEQVGLVGFFYPTTGVLDTGAFFSAYPDLTNPTLTLDVYTGDLGINDGVPRSVYVLDTSDTTLRAVFFEDAAALVGLVIAGGSILLHQITGNAMWDAIGSILVGVLLGIVALLLIQRNFIFLLGTSVPAELRNAAGWSILHSPGVSRVTYLHIEFVGPNRLFLVAEVDLTGDDVEHDVARRLRDIERSIAQHQLIEAVTLSLSVDDEASLEFTQPTTKASALLASFDFPAAQA